MTLMRWDPWTEFRRISRAMDEMLDEFLGRLRPWGGEVRPFPLDMYETDDALVVKAFLPGLRPEDVEVSVQGEVLTIRAEGQREEGEERRTYHYRELYHGPFVRSLALPVPVDADAAHAAYEQGILTITLPKAAEARPKAIRVQAREVIEAKAS
jgi:HSP20 family protein